MALGERVIIVHMDSAHDSFNRDSPGDEVKSGRLDPLRSTVDGTLDLLRVDVWHAIAPHARRGSECQEARGCADWRAPQSAHMEEVVWRR